MSHTASLHTDAGHGSVKSYVVGFLLSIVLTLIPFGVVMMGDYSQATMLYTVVGTAVVQILVQLAFFLHMNFSSEGGWNLTAFIFTVLIIAILVVGSLWIMYHLNTNMMLH